MVDIYQKLKELNISIPQLQPPAGSYIPGIISGNLVFVSGQTPTEQGELAFKGKVGRELNIQEGYEAAKLACLNCLAELKYVVGDLNRIKRVVKINGYVNATSDFGNEPQVVNGASDLVIAIWGENGQHARAAIGVADLPGGAPVEIELTAEIQ
jgi:enamine deaminase RidA (YjgF/YER057c/UK114 family)